MSVAEFAGQAILHALVAALVVESLIRLWRIGAPDLRLGFCLLALAFPVLVLPAFFLLAPARGEEWFRERWALFSGSRWGDLQVGGVGLDAVGLGLLSALGVTLFLADLVPFLADQLTGRALKSASPAKGSEAIAREVEEIAGAMDIPAPPVLLLESPTPLLLCAGVRRPALVLSRGAVECLDRQERRVAFAHELGHLARRDPLLGWILMALRTAMFFNPVVQVVARVAVRDMEWRADDLAVRATSDRMALAAGLVKLYRSGPGRGGPGRRRIPWGLLTAACPARARARAIETRCRRLLDHEPSAPVRFGGLRFVLTGLALSLLLFFVV